MSDVINQLFLHLPLERITTFSCGHIIPEKNLQALVVSKSPRGSDLEYKADKQGNPTVVSLNNGSWVCQIYISDDISPSFCVNQITELGQILLNFTNVVPGGVVVFFPSYSFLKAAKANWESGGILERFWVKREVSFAPFCSSSHLKQIGLNFDTDKMPLRCFLNLTIPQPLIGF